MNTLHFKYAVEVERTRSISKAAENLFMAQPNLSKAIKELEDSLGITIFQRTSKGVVPTQQGAEFLKYAKNILTELDKMESIYVPDAQNRQSLKLSIPRGSYISNAYINFIAELDMSQEINICIQETNSMQTITNLEKNNFNLGIVRYQTIYEKYYMDYLAEKNMAYEPIWNFQFLAIMSSKHACAKDKRIIYNKLAASSIEIVHADTVIPYISTPEVKKPATKPDVDYIPKKVYVYERGSQFAMLHQLPSTFMLVSPIPEYLTDIYDLVQRKCEMDDNDFKDILIYPKGYTMTRFDRAFINKLFEAKNEVAFKEYN